MAKVVITTLLQKAIEKKFNAQSIEILLTMKSLEANPGRGKAVGHVHDVVIKELKHGKYRFYCVTDGHVLKFGTKEELASLLIKFVRMSEKKDQQRVIDEIKSILKSVGLEAF